MVTAFDYAHFSITIIFSCVVPNEISLTVSALPSFSGVISLNLGIILPPVAIAINSISVPETHLTAGKPFCNNKWLASSSKPH